MQRERAAVSPNWERDRSGCTSFLVILFGRLFRHRERVYNMDPKTFWKNFNLGQEIDIAGRFLYNGLHFFHQMDTLYHEEEVFEVLYNLSVGLERLMKVAVVLIEHTDSTDHEDFEATLITHNHLELLRRVRSRYSLALSNPHTEFLHLLTEFYKTYRYGRYSLSSVKTLGHEKKVLHAFVHKYLGVKIEDDSSIFPTRNDHRIKKFLGNIVGKMAQEIYEVVRKEAACLGIYTWEIRDASKAWKIFINKEYDFHKEDVLWRELLIFFVQSVQERGHMHFMREIEPLDFDPGLEGEYLESFGSDEKKLLVLEELEFHYQELENPGERLKTVGLLGNPSVHFNWDEPEDDDSDSEESDGNGSDGNGGGLG